MLTARWTDSTSIGIKMDPWLAGMLARKPKKVVAVALANRTARRDRAAPAVQEAVTELALLEREAMDRKRVFDAPGADPCASGSLWRCPDTKSAFGRTKAPVVQATGPLAVGALPANRGC